MNSAMMSRSWVPRSSGRPISIRAQGEKTVHDGGAVIRKIRQQLEKPGFAGSHIHHQVFEAPQILGPEQKKPMN